jgi:hypothetical protein
MRLVVQRSLSIAKKKRNCILIIRSEASSKKATFILLASFTEMGYVCTPSNDVTDAIWTAFGATVGAGVSCLALSALTSSS